MPERARLESSMWQHVFHVFNSRLTAQVRALGYCDQPLAFEHGLVLPPGIVSVSLVA